MRVPRASRKHAAVYRRKWSATLVRARMNFERNSLLLSLPIKAGAGSIRRWTRDDVERRAAWPEYPEQYSAFNGTLHLLSQHERDEYFSSRERDPNRVTLALDHAPATTIGHVVVKEIDWVNGTVGNMGVRLHPDWCDQGVGTAMMLGTVGWLGDFGAKRISLDVALANTRALCCYEKAGFVPGRQFERDGVSFTWMHWTSGGPKVHRART
jgi:RimJ/RimL family protein N-acetyltransferase